MVKMSVLYKKTANEQAFEERYPQHLLLMEALPGLIRRQACTVLGSPAGASPYHRIIELYFADYDALDAALRSSAGQAAGQDLVSFTGRDSEVIFAEVFEE